MWEEDFDDMGGIEAVARHKGVEGLCVVGTDRLIGCKRVEIVAPAVETYGLLEYEVGWVDRKLANEFEIDASWKHGL